MKLYKLVVDFSNASVHKVGIKPHETCYIGIKPLFDGKEIDVELELDTADECLVVKEELHGLQCFQIDDPTYDQAAKLNAGVYGTKTIIIDVDEKAGYIEIEEKEEKKDDPQKKKKLVFGPKWPDQTSVYYNQDEMFETFPGNQIEGLTSWSLLPGVFALTRPLSGGGPETLANANTVEQDTLVTEFKQGYTLHNQISSNGRPYAVNCLINRNQNVRINGDGYKINVACFAPGEMVAIRDGNRDEFVNPGQEAWLSANTAMYNPFQ